MLFSSYGSSHFPIQELEFRVFRGIIPHTSWSHFQVLRAQVLNLEALLIINPWLTWVGCKLGLGQKTGVCDHLNLSILTQVISRKCHNTNYLHSELKSLWTYISFSIASETWTYQAFIFNFSAPSNKCVNISSPLRGLKSKLISLINCCSCSKTRSLTSA